MNKYYNWITYNRCNGEEVRKWTKKSKYSLHIRWKIHLYFIIYMQVVKSWEQENCNLRCNIVHSNVNIKNLLILRNTHRYTHKQQFSSIPLNTDFYLITTVCCFFMILKDNFCLLILMMPDLQTLLSIFSKVLKLNKTTTTKTNEKFECTRDAFSSITFFPIILYTFFLLCMYSVLYFAFELHTFSWLESASIDFLKKWNCNGRCATFKLRTRAKKAKQSSNTTAKKKKKKHDIEV